MQTTHHHACHVLSCTHLFRIKSKMSNSPLSSWADLSTILASLTAVIALGVSAKQFYKTQQSTQETQAVELYLKWNDLSAEQEKIRLPKNAVNVTSNPSHWIGNNKMAITEALFELTRESREWRSTLRYMLSMQSDFIFEGGFDVDTYSLDFRKFCSSEGFQLKRSSEVPNSETTCVY